MKTLKTHSVKLYMILTLIGLIILSLLLPSLAAANPLTDRQRVGHALARASDIGQYQYRTTVVQTLHPVLSLDNVGRTARTDQYVIEGKMDAPAKSINLQMTVANQPPLQIKVENGRSYGRASDQDPWTETEFATDFSAPGGDPMGFLVAAENVRLVDAGAEDAFFPTGMLPASYAQSVTRYKFNMNGVKYAQAMRAEMEDYLRSQGALPQGITLELAKQYTGMSGGGEIWIDSDGLPVRQILRLTFPAQPGAREWTEAEITTEFSGWAQKPANLLALNWDQPRLALGSILGQDGARKMQQAGLTLGILLVMLALAGVTFRYRNSLPVRRIVYGAVIFSMVVMPTLKSTQTAAAYSRLSEIQAQAQDQQLATSTGEQATLNPHQSPLAQNQPSTTASSTNGINLQSISSTCVITATSDCDGDGLTDNVELYQLGTRIDKIDTDGDGISDKTEVTPFKVNGQDWYLDPLKADTNGDGLTDGAECLGRTDVVTTTLLTVLEDTCQDSDGDTVPDIYDFDDDGDGVPDSVDISHLDFITVTNQTFNLEISGAATDTNLFVDFQIRPKDERHLEWTNSTLNWPDGDTSGQIRRVTPDTLTADGDMVLIPMLEITIPYSTTNPSGGLPISGTVSSATITQTTPLSNWLDTEMLNKYQINVTLSQNGDRIAYVPLVQATDPNGGMPVAWQARMPYRLANGISGWGAAHQVKLIWLVTGQQDSCAADCADPANWTSTTRILQTYYDDFIVTGMKVQENHGAQAMMVAQSTNTGVYEPELWHLADTLQTVYLESQTVNNQRFTLADIPTTYTSWGMSGGSLTFNHITGLVDDAALVEAVTGDAVPAFLRTNIYTTDPISGTVAGVMLLSEQTQRIRTMGDVDFVDNNGEPELLDRFVFANNTFQVDLGSAPLETSGTMRVQPYRFTSGLGWDTVAPAALLDDLKTALDSVLTPAVMTDLLAGDEVDDLTQARDGAIIMAINYYLGFYVANALPLAVDGVPYGGQPLVNGDHLRPAEPVEAIVQRLATNLKSYFGQLSLAELNIPTVENDQRAGAAQAWAQLAASRGAVLAGVGAILRGNTASSAARALLQVANYPRLFDGGALLDLRAYSILNTVLGDFFSGKVVPFLTDRKAGVDNSQFGQVTKGGLLSAAYTVKTDALLIKSLYTYDGKIIREMLKDKMFKFGLFGNAITAIEQGREDLKHWLKAGDSVEIKVEIKKARLDLAAAQAHYDSIITTKVKLWQMSGLATQFAVSGLTIALALADGAVQADSPAFSRLVAEQIGAVVVETFSAIISLVALQTATFALARFITILAVIDTVMTAVCAVFNLGKDENYARWFCGGISGALAQALAYVVNDTTPLVDLQRSDRLSVVLDTPVFGNESGQDGVLVGNSVTLSGTVTNTLYMDDPNWLGYTWWWQWSDNYLDDATFEYRLQPSEQDIPLDLNGTTWIDVPGKKSSSISANDARFYQSFPIKPLVHTFSAPGINQGLNAYLSEGYAVQQQNCWLTVVGLLVSCWLSKYDDTSHLSLENRFVFDVLPATIDDFRTVVLEFNNDGRPGYRLAWDDQFPILADADGDGLRSQAMGGVDPNDSTPDSDGDGLSDTFEMNAKGFDPTQVDGDCDGLTDYWELFYGTDPSRADSDGDGLLDGEEFFHPNRINPYENSLRSNDAPPACSTSAAAYTGGWKIVYDYDSSGNPLSTWVSANPNDPDSDDDTLSDKQERIYAYNPNVASSLQVLRLDSQIETSSSLQPYVRPTGSITYTAVVTNELALPYARGLLEAELPLDNVLRDQTIGILAPQTAVTLTNNLGVAEAGLTTSGPVDMGIRAGAIIADPTGRALWLHMNEPAGSTTFADSSFLGNDASCSGASCPTANGTVLTFDGGDVVSIPDDETLDLTQYTLALAIKPTQSSSSVLLTKTSGNGGAQNYSLALSNTGRAQFPTIGGCAAEGGFNIIETPPLPLNQWSHIAATFDGSTKRLYLNGLEVASAAFNGSACLTNDPVTIGGRDAFGSLVSPFTGQIDEVEIYPTALDAGTIGQRYSASVLSVDMRDAVTWGSNAVSCSGAECPTLNGSGATFAQVNHLTATAPDLSGDAFTFATWIKPEQRNHPFTAGATSAFGKWTDADYQGVFGYRDAWDGKTIYPSLYVGSNGRLRMIWGDGTNTCEVSTVNTGVVNLGTWQYLTVSYDGSNLNFYVNGQPIAGGTTGSCAAVTPPTVSTFDIGRPNPFGYLYFDYVKFFHFEDPSGAAGGQNVEMRLNFDNDGSAGNLAWANLTEGISNTPSWTLNKTSVLDDASNSWFRLWENYDGGCFITCPEDQSSDTNFDTGGSQPDHSLKQITGIKNVNYLGQQSLNYFYPTSINTGWPLTGDIYWSNNNDFFQGELDDFEVYASALDAQRVAQLYNANYVSLDLLFDEAPGATLFADDSGSFTSVACSGATCPTSGVPGRNNQAVEFDGVNDYLLLGSSTDELGFTSGDFSVMMWIKPNDFLGSLGNGLVPLMEIGDHNYIGLYNGRITVQGAVLAQEKDTLYNATGRWYHLAFVYDKAQARYTLYLNGQSIWQQTYGVPSAAASLQIGRWTSVSGSNYYYNGLMDELTVAKRALTQAEIQAYINRAPVINLHLDEDLSGASFVDDSHNRYIATCSSTDTCPDAGDKGQIREAVTFDGNDQLTLASTNSTAFTNFSAGLWVKPTKTTSGAQWLMTKSNSNFFDASFRLQLLPNSMTVRFDRQFVCTNGDGSFLGVNANTPLLENQWNHVMVTHDKASVLSIYINGTLAGTANWGTTSLCTSSNPIRLGQNFNGGLDEVAVYPTVLTAGQVADIYQYQVAWFDVINHHSIYVDADLPTIDLSLTPANLSAAETVLYIGVADASSPVIRAEYRIDSGNWQSATPSNGDATTSESWLYYFQGSAGTHTIEARSTDAVGNVSTIASATVRVDDGAPTVTLNTTASVLPFADNHIISGTVTDAESGVISNTVNVITLDHTGAPVTGEQPAIVDQSNTWHTSQSFLETPYGVYTTTVRATDGVGNSASASGIFKLDGLPPYADVTDGRNFVGTNASKTITGIASDVPYPAKGRTLHLHFETGSGLWEDGSQSGFTMQCSGVTCPTSVNPGKRGTAINLDGIDDVLEFTSSGNITTTTTAQQLGLVDGSFTVMAWVNAADWSGDHALLGSSPADGFYLGIQNSSPILGYGGDDTVMTGTIPTGEWVHLTWRFNADTGERAFFVNGRLRSSSDGHSPYGATDDILIGQARGSKAFGGELDELVIYAQPLGDETIYDIANPLDVGVSSLQIRVRSYEQRDLGQYGGSWYPVSLNNTGQLFSTWQYNLPVLPAGAYKIDLQVVDAVGNQNFVEGAWDFAVVAPDLTVTKDSAVTLATTGGTIDYTITYTNTSLVAANGAVLTETVPTDAAFNAGMSNPNWSCLPDSSAGSNCTLALGDIPSGESGVISFTVTVADSWSAGITAIDNTVVIGMDGADNNSADNSATHQIPIDGGVNLAVSISDGGNSFQYTTEGSSPVVYTMTYTNTGSQASEPQLSVAWSQGGNRDPFDPDTNWVCVTDPYTLEGYNTCTRNLGALGIGQSGFVTFTLYTGYYLPDSMLITTTVAISDALGANELDSSDNIDTAVTPIQTDYSVALGQSVITVPEGSIITNTGQLLTPPYDPAYPPLFALYPAPSAGTYTNIDWDNLNWSWVYTSTDGPDESQIVTWNVAVGEGAFTLKPSFKINVINVPPTVAITVPNTVAAGEVFDVGFGPLVDPGQDTMVDCTLYWGDGTYDDCYNIFDVPGRTLAHAYGSDHAHPTIKVSVEDEDGIFVAASKTLTVTGVTTSLSVDQSSISGFESQTVTNTGTYSPLDASLSWSASEGTVTDEGNGIWSWNLGPGGNEGTRGVTITAGSQIVTFTLDIQGDGVSSSEEDGAPNGGDGNHDGIPDSDQMNVASVASPLNGQYLTVAASEGMTLTNVSLSDTPSAGSGSQPHRVKFPFGYLNFELAGLTPGGSTEVTIYMTDTSGIKNYYKYNTTSGWFRFSYNGSTGAEVLADRINLYLVDGDRGDADGLLNGIIVDPGGPAYELAEYGLTINVAGGGSVSQASGTFAEGTVLALTATPDPGWSFSGWSGALTGSTATQSLTMNQDKTVTAIFTRDEYTLARRVVGSGRVAISPNQGSYVYGDLVALTAIPTTGWSFSGWSGDLSGGSAGESLTIDGSKTITATFTQNAYSVDVNATGSGSVILNPQQDSYVYGDIVYAEARPDPGYALQNWSGDLSGDGYLQQLIINGNKSISAIFATATYSVESAVRGAGSITIEPEQVNYAYGDVITVTATPDPGWYLNNWDLDLSGITTTQSLSITENTNILAVFEQDAYILNTSWIGSGSITVLPDQPTFTYGEIVTVTATPAEDYAFIGWSEDINETLPTVTLIMTESKSILASFNPISSSYALTVNKDGAGTGTVSGALAGIDCGNECGATLPLSSVITLTASADPGSIFTGWSGDLSGTTNPISLTITADTAVTATFTLGQPPTITSADSITFTEGVAGSFTITTAAGIPTATTLSESGALPGGVSFTDNGDGTATLSGTPAFGTFGTYNLTLTASNGIAPDAVQNFTLNVLPGTVQVTVEADPSGLSFTVDGTTYTSAQTFTWNVGSSHTLATSSPQTGTPGMQYAFDNWSDGGAVSHSVTAPATDSTYTATFKTQYELTTAVNPSNGGSISPASGTYYDANTDVSLTATANSGFTFLNWTGDVADATAASTTITMSEPQSVTANFKASTSLLYNGDQVVNIGNNVKLAVQLSSPALACTSAQSIDFSLDVNPLDGSAGPYSLGSATTASNGQATLSVSTSGWQEGIYDITASFAGTTACDPTSDDATLTAASPGNSATGGGWYPLPGNGHINFGFNVRKVDDTCQSNCAYKGQVLLINNGKWRLKGTLDSYVQTSTGQGAASGTGDLYWWDQSLNGGLGDWSLAQSGVSFAINFYDSGQKGKKSSDTFGINIQYTPVPPQPNSLPNSDPQPLKGGNIQVN